MEAGPRIRYLLPTLVLALFLGGFSTVTPAGEWTRFAPEVDPDIARHLDRDSDAEWIEYCRHLGVGALGIAEQQIAEHLRVPDFGQFCARRQSLDHALLRIGVGFRGAFGYRAPEARTRWVMRRDARSEFVVRGSESLYIALSVDRGSSPGRRIAVADSMARCYLAAQDPYRAIYVGALAAQWELEAGHPERHRERLERLAALARECGEDYMLCQFLGQLGIVHDDAGREDSMRVCFEEGIACATRHSFIEQATRLLRFEAGFYSRHGRYTMALDRLAEAARLSREPGGETARVRMQIESAKLYASLGCWDLVEQSLRPVPPLVRAIPAFARDVVRAKQQFDTDLLRARLEFEARRVDRGDAAMRALIQRIPATERRVPTAELLTSWSAGLESAHRDRDADDVCRNAIAFCDSAHVPEYLPVLLLRRARLALALNDPAAADERLDTLDRRLAMRAEGVPPQRIQARVLRARLLRATGRRAEMARELRATLRDYLERLDRTEPGDLDPTELEDGVALHDAILESGELSAAAGYEFEMAWRSLKIGRERSGAVVLAAFPEWSPSRAPSRCPPGIHLLYRFVGDRLLRWRADSSGIVLDTLECSPGNCLREVRGVLDVLQGGTEFAGATTAPSAALAGLASRLLPHDLPTMGSRVLPIHITPDGPLAALPFGVLPTRGGAPLAAVADIDYLRGWNDEPVRPGGEAVVVSDPALEPGVARRYGLDPTLPGTEREARQVLARWPHTRLLAGAAATKRAIRSSLPGASIVYLAAHHVRDVDAPFLGFIPVAAGADASPDASMLELADVRALDLSACRLAVLASCSSGVSERASAAGGGSNFSEAFLDAGAHAVVGSFWDVGDEEAASFMSRFLARWQPEGSDAAALGVATRDAIRAGVPARVWAAWAVGTVERGKDRTIELASASRGEADRVIRRTSLKGAGRIARSQLP